MTEKVDKLKDLLEIQGNNGNWNYCEYMRGMYNGMQLSLSVFTDEDPEFRDAPDPYLFKEPVIKYDNPVLQRTWEEYNILLKLYGDDA